MQNAPPVDFSAVVQALQDRAGSLLALSVRIGVSRGALRGYLDGSQPPHTLGCQLIAEWCTVTGLGEGDLPRAAQWSPPRREARPAAKIATTADGAAILAAAVGRWRQSVA